MPFYQRILLSSWVIVVITLTLTFGVANFLPEGPRTADERRLATHTVAVLADDLRAALAEHPESKMDALLGGRVLDYSPLLVIYVIDPAGRDVLDRPLPPRVARVAAGGAPVGLLADPHVESDGLSGYLVVGDDAVFPLVWLLARPGGRALMVLTALVVSAFISVMLARFIVRPVRQMREAGQQVAAGDLTVRVAHTVGNRSDDIARLARDFDRMTERVEALLGNQQRLMRDVSHELRSPLARLQALLSIARQRTSDPEAAQLDRIESELGRLDELIGSILAFARLKAIEDLKRQPTDLIDLTQNIVDDASVEAQLTDKQLRLHGPDRYVLDIDGGSIAQALENVVRNAVRHTGDGTTVDVIVAREEGTARITVEDRGEGVPTEALGQLFEPFFRVETGRSTRSGSGGLGLAIAERSVRLHGGRIHAENRETGGLRVVISLPA
jgi:signal transduction histidine kinase